MVESMLTSLALTLLFLSLCSWATVKGIRLVVHHEQKAYWLRRRLYRTPDQEALNCLLLAQSTLFFAYRNGQVEDHLNEAIEILKVKENGLMPKIPYHKPSKTAVEEALTHVLAAQNILHFVYRHEGVEDLLNKAVEALRTVSSAPVAEVIKISKTGELLSDGYQTLTRE